MLCSLQGVNRWERKHKRGDESYRIFIKDLRFSRLLRFARNDRLRVLFVIASEAKQSLSKPQLFSEVSIVSSLLF